MIEKFDTENSYNDKNSSGLSASTVQHMLDVQAEAVVNKVKQEMMMTNSSSTGPTYGNRQLKPTQIHFTNRDGRKQTVYTMEEDVAPLQNEQLWTHDEVLYARQSCRRKAKHRSSCDPCCRRQSQR